MKYSEFVCVTLVASLLIALLCGDWLWGPTKLGLTRTIIVRIAGVLVGACLITGLRFLADGR